MNPHIALLQRRLVELALLRHRPLVSDRGHGLDRGVTALAAGAMTVTAIESRTSAMRTRAETAIGIRRETVSGSVIAAAAGVAIGSEIGNGIATAIAAAEAGAAAGTGIAVVADERIQCIVARHCVQNSAADSATTTTTSSSSSNPDAWDHDDATFRRRLNADWPS